MIALAAWAIGGIVDLALVVMLAEAVCLALYHRRTGRGIAPRDLLGTLAAGFFLVLALRASLGASRGGDRFDAPVLLLCLTLSLAAHVYDLTRRWRPR